VIRRVASALGIEAFLISDQQPRAPHLVCSNRLAWPNPPHRFLTQLDQTRKIGREAPRLKWFPSAESNAAAKPDQACLYGWPECGGTAMRVFHNIA